MIDRAHDLVHLKQQMKREREKEFLKKN